MSNYTIDAHSFDTYYYTALLSTFGTCTQLLLFGILLVLLFNTTYLLHTGIRTSRSWLVVATCAMGLFAALHLARKIAITVLSWRFFYLRVQGDAAGRLSVLSRGGVLDVVNDSRFVANNIVIDSLFIHRCYVVWGRNIKVVIVPALLLAASTVTGSVGTPQPDEKARSDHKNYRMAFGMIILTTNLMLMALTAGRIWWIRRDVVTVLERSVTRTYDTVIAMMYDDTSWGFSLPWPAHDRCSEYRLESGAIYCISIIVYLIAGARLNRPDSLAAISVFEAALPQVMNIAPILILVRVGSGCSLAGETSSSGYWSLQVGDLIRSTV
ncbi:hypothetical protein B0H19DRAFT_1373882 [Mycena capillaripes]|nr:hypothetical protein B0H19DRAFT_1373882 [Mycena capillaripes]